MNSRKNRFKQLEKQIRENSLDGQYYEYLGDYYLEENVEKAYLCYENALFLGNVQEDVVENKLLQLEQKGINCHKVSIVILSYNAKNMMIDCVESIRRNNPSNAYELVVVDNASTDGIVDWIKEQNDIVLQCNEENVGFPKGCNQGIRLAKHDYDIMLLNNDTIVTENALFWLRMALCESQMGAVGSISNMTEKLSSDGMGKEKRSKEEQLEQAVHNNILMEFPYEMGLFLRGYAMILERHALEKIGYLDERFSPGNFEDNDICFRMVQAGYRLAMCYNSFIFHYGSTSFNEKREWYLDIYRKNYLLFNEKYGFDAGYYIGQRWDLIQYLPEDPGKSFKVLEIGCGYGNTLARIRGLYPKAEVVGIEKCQKAVDIGSKVVNMYCLDIDKQDLPFEKGTFDYIIMGNVLEQMSNPKSVLKKVREYLKTEGKIILSVYNAANIKNVYGLLSGSYNYGNGRDMWNIRNVRWFTGVGVIQMLRDCGLEIMDIESIGNIMSHKEEELIRSFEEILSETEEAMLRTDNYIVVAQKD